MDGETRHAQNAWSGFVAQAKQAGIQRLEESGTSPDEYQRSVEQQLRVSVEGNLAFGKHGAPADPAAARSMPRAERRP